MYDIYIYSEGQPHCDILMICEKKKKFWSLLILGRQAGSQE